MEFLIIWLVSWAVCFMTFWFTMWGTAELKGYTWADLGWFHFIMLVPFGNTIAAIFVVTEAVLGWASKRLRGKPFAHKDWRK